MRAVLPLLSFLLHAQIEPQATAILRKNCLGCHSASSKMGGLILESRDAALQKTTFATILDKVNSGKMPPGNPLAPADRAVHREVDRRGRPLDLIHHRQRAQARRSGSLVAAAAPDRTQPLHRLPHQRRAHSQRTQAQQARRQAHADPPRDLRPYRTSAHTRRNRSLSRRQQRECL